jgi:hypothetical protein
LHGRQTAHASEWEAGPVIYMSPEVYRDYARKKIEEEKRIAGELGLREQ